MHVDTDADDLTPENGYVEVAVEVFRLLADATRIRIVLALRAGELPVNAIAETVGRSPAAVSQHLAKLRWGKLVRIRQDGNRVFYRLTDEHAMRLVIEAIRQAEHAVDERPGHHA
ncbi:ArsR family transcriptional regulator [Microbacterium testaceum]|jgi:DNA-binding transcriptional ArsR family regulator|uniref:ArsR family transcriptional regulator n=1 Tax=Microbacterium testaceum TaxID=2033 RepID=A0A147FB95_MICTE|nr:metalloregulator ArsR/SmtB family transcription factor [Microbacterium testaceum]KTS13780.1 ArsR family transcriptional regulator [Microbacterium testaceum]KTS55388.1 ArsR family transcriptional regulator [Microbacterium testaceum]